MFHILIAPFQLFLFPHSALFQLVLNVISSGCLLQHLQFCLPAAPICFPELRRSLHPLCSLALRRPSPAATLSGQRSVSHIASSSSCSSAPLPSSTTNTAETVMQKGLFVSESPSAEGLMVAGLADYQNKRDVINCRAVSAKLWKEAAGFQQGLCRRSLHFVPIQVSVRL